MLVSVPLPAQVAPQRITAAELGQMLFFDPVLSGNYKRSCASCHRPQKAFTDQRVTARAYAFASNLTTNTPTLLGAARQRRFFHDGRASTLPDVIEAVLTNPNELSNTYEETTRRLNNSDTYRQWFEHVYGSGPDKRTINAALVTYLHTLAPAPPRTAITRTADGRPPRRVRAGYVAFAKAGCTTCHAGPDFRDGRRHEVVPGVWVRTPTLRYLPLTPPYLHDGSAPTLDAVLISSFHTRWVRSLTAAQVRSVVSFLNALPADTTALAQAIPTELPFIPNAPNRRVGGSY